MLNKNKNLFTKSIPLLMLDMAEGDNADGNNIKAMVTTFNDPDVSGDIFLPQAFDKFLKEFEKDGRPLQMQIGHNNTVVAGEWHTLTKNAKGIIAEGRIFDDLEDGKRAKKLLERKIVKDVSIGLSSRKWVHMEGGGVEFAEASLREISLVTHPANKNANVVSVKEDTRDDDFITKLTRDLDTRITNTDNQKIAAHIEKLLTT